jgi:hypothetical protein
MKNYKDLLLIVAISVILSITGFILDLNERVPDIRTNIFEIIMMAGFAFGVIIFFYFPIKFLLSKSRRLNDTPPPHG